jgi:hypothetical protein
MRRRVEHHPGSPRSGAEREPVQNPPCDAWVSSAIGSSIAIGAATTTGNTHQNRRRQTPRRVLKRLSANPPARPSTPSFATFTAAHKDAAALDIEVASG